MGDKRSYCLSPSFYYQRLEVNDTGVYWPNLSDPTSAIYRDGNRLANPSTDPFWLAALRADWNLGFAELVSNTSYYSRSMHSVSDYTQYLRVSFLANTYPTSPQYASRSPFSDTQGNFYQEIRLSSGDAHARLIWSTGFFFSRTSENVRQSITDPTLDSEFAALFGESLCTDYLGYACPNGDLYDSNLNKIVDTQFALFGEATFKITPTLGFTAGLRVSNVEYVGTTEVGGALQGAPPASTYNSNSEKPVTPKAVLTWQPNAENLAYVSATKGYRVGGVNVEVGALCNPRL